MSGRPETEKATGAATPMALNETLAKGSIMNVAIPSGNFNGLVNEALKTTSRIIADRFEKRHADVVRAIRDLIGGNEDWGQRNFAHTPYIDPQNGQTYQMYEMTRDGYSLLVMGFTGKKAMDWKIKFLAAFNAMEAKLRQSSQIDLNDPTQLVPLLTSYAQRTQIAEAKVIEMSPKAEAFDRLDTAEGNLTVRPASKVLGFPERQLTKWMEVHRWAFRQSGKGPLQAYVEKRNTGYLDHRLETYTDQNTGEDKVRATMVITPKGMARLAQVLPHVGGAS